MIERRVRLWSGLVIAAYVLVHLLNHALGLGSLETAEATLRWVLKVWGNPVGQVLLYGSFLVHFSMSLLAVYRRGTLRMPPWEAVQIGLGLMVVPLILIHVIGTRVIGFSLGFEPTYAYVVASIWVSDPLRGAQQAFALVVVWGHLCAGIHFWLRHRPWYPRLLPILYPVAIIVPILALLDFAGMGATVAERARQAGYLASVFADVTAAPAGTIARFKGLEPIAFGVFVALIALTLIAREARRVHRNRFGVFRVTLPDGRVVVAPLGQSDLEALRDAGVPHASVCGGRGRCTSCRVDVGTAQKSLAAPEATEAKALARIRAEAGVRLACQIRPAADLEIVPLLPPDVSARDANRPGGIQGREQPVVSMFLDMRGSTRLGEEKLPFDVLFILNRFFAEMAEALAETSGHYAQFAGDGLMALYGVRGGLREGCRNAVLGAASMMDRMDALNRDLAVELSEPLRLGIGIHAGDAIVGTMGPPNAQNFSAIGDNVNVAARLETLTKAYDCALVISEAAAEAAELDMSDFPRHEAEVRGRGGMVAVFAVEDPRRIPGVAEMRPAAGADRQAGAPRPHGAGAQGPSPDPGADQRVGTGGSLE